MRIQSEKLKETEASPELVYELVRDKSQRGEFMIMMHDDDEEAYVPMGKIWPTDRFLHQMLHLLGRT